MATTTAIEPWTAEDVPPVADLHVRAFLRTSDSAGEGVRRFLRTFFLENPWCDDAIPSLVARDPRGVVRGFVGAIPRWMSWKGARLRAAISTRLIVDPELRDPSCALRLMRRFLDGPQQLSISDSASVTSRKLIEALGGVTAPAKSMNWMRLLRPTTQLSVWAQRNRRVAPLARFAGPALRALDAVGLRIPKNPLALPAVSSRCRRASDQELLACLEQAGRSYGLRPHYESSDFGWILDRLREDRARGDLRAIIVLDGDGRDLGSCIFYQTAGVAEVMQLATTGNYAHEVLGQVIRAAHGGGAAALSGRFDPRFADALWDHGCVAVAGHAAVYHTAEQEIEKALLTDGALISALEGELFLPSPMDLR